MSTFTWTATGGGDWSTPTDWDIGTAPNDATAVAIIPGAPGAYTVTIGASDNQTINAITLGDFAGGHVGPTLEIAGSLTFAGNGPTLGFQSGLLQIDAGGVLAGQGLLGSGPQGSGVSRGQQRHGARQCRSQHRAGRGRALHQQRHGARRQWLGRDRRLHPHQPVRHNADRRHLDSPGSNSRRLQPDRARLQLRCGHCDRRREHRAGRPRLRDPRIRRSTAHRRQLPADRTATVEHRRHRHPATVERPRLCHRERTGRRGVADPARWHAGHRRTNDRHQRYACRLRRRDRKCRQSRGDPRQWRRVGSHHSGQRHRRSWCHTRQHADPEWCDRRGDQQSGHDLCGIRTAGGRRPVGGLGHAGRAERRHDRVLHRHIAERRVQRQRCDPSARQLRRLPRRACRLRPGRLPGAGGQRLRPAPSCPVRPWW